jgi:hypothetical protein
MNDKGGPQASHDYASTLLCFPSFSFSWVVFRELCAMNSYHTLEIYQNMTYPAFQCRLML